MLFVTHLAAALHVAAWTGHPLAALIGTLLPDIDHFLKSRHAVNLKKLMKYSLTPTTAYPPRPYFHNWIALACFGALAFLIHPASGVAFALAFAVHLILDAIDHTDLRPFFPFRMNIRGPIRYNSFAEHLLAFTLLTSYLLFFA